MTITDDNRVCLNIICRRNFFMSKDKMIIVFGLIAGMVSLAFTVVYVGQGNVRNAEIFWPESVRQTIGFYDENGNTVVRGITGVLGENPTLLSRTGFAYILTVENHGMQNHTLYIDGFEAHTKEIEPGGLEIIRLFPDKPGIYTYYDKNEDLLKLGQLEIVSVVPSDEFTGIWKDLI